MENQTPLHQKHFSSFWPIVIIVILSAIVGGLIVWIVFNDNLANDVSSMVFNVRHPASSQRASTTPATEGRLMRK
jgi:hypothetical protein